MYKKKAIPDRVRRAVAERAGCVPLQRDFPCPCYYCGEIGFIHWMSPSWVCFRGLELDHLYPERHGGEMTVENIVLACRLCNRTKGHKILKELRPRWLESERSSPSFSLQK